MQPRSVTLTTYRARIVSAMVALAAAFASLVVATAAAAQEPPPSPPAASFSSAGTEAAALYAQGDVDAAIAKLEATPEESRTAVDRSLLGALYFEAGRLEDAWTVLAPLAAQSEADAAVLYQAGRTALALGQRRRAFELFERSVRLVPRSPAARELGLLAGQRSQYERSYALLGPWAMGHPDDLVAVLAAAAAAVRLDRLRDAELLLRAVPESDPGGKLLRGQVALGTGKPQEASEILGELYGEHPPGLDLDLRCLLADSYIQLGRSSEAIPLTEPCSRHDPRCALLLAEARYRGGEIPAALDGLEPLASVALNDPAALDTAVRARLAQMFGRLLVAAARYSDALPYLELSSELLPDEPLSWKSLGDALAAVGRRDEALAAMHRFREVSEAANELHREQEAEQQNPMRAAIREAEKLLADGDGDAALAILRREIVLDPSNAVLRLTEIQMLLRLERLDAALASAEELVRALPDTPDVIYTRGIVHMARRELAPAEADFQTTLRLAPGHVPALNDYAVLLTNSGRRPEARRLLERALQLNPDDALAARNLKSLDDAEP